LEGKKERRVCRMIKASFAIIESGEGKGKVDIEEKKLTNVGNSSF
jgi:hypothetical protein